MSDKKPKKYYKVIWHYCDSNCDDGGKYMQQESGVYFADSEHPFFKIAKKCQDLSDKISTIYKNDNTYMESAITSYQERVEISKAEYDVCQKVFSTPFIYSGCPDHGGIQPGDATLDDIYQSVKELLEEFEKEYNKAKTFIKGLAKQVKKDGVVDVDRIYFDLYERSFLESYGLKECYETQKDWPLGPSRKVLRKK
jgi:hypothetical protein